MKYFILIVLLLTIPLSYTSAQEGELQQLKQSYLRNRDYKSLKKLSSYLKPGMSQKEVEALLGKPDYSPIEGEYYYSSKKMVKVNKTITCPMGLSIYYYNQRDKPNPKLKLGDLRSFSILTLCE